MLKLCDLIELAGVKLWDFKIHLATGRNPTPMEAYLDGKFREWQEIQTKRNFQCAQVLSLIQMQPARWLFAGVFKVHGVRPTTFAGRPHFRYKTTLVKGLDHLVGRAVVSFKRDFRASYLVGHKYADQLLVAEILGQKVSVGDFPGYRSVLLSHRVLQTIAREQLPAWKAALSSVSGVYVILDTNGGKQYVGSAAGVGGIWARWCSYAKNGHGGNKDLKQLLSKKGPNYAQNLQYAVVEVCDIAASEDTVEEREAHWKTVLGSRQFGLNAN